MKDLLQRFWKDSTGTSSIEFVLLFPIFIGFFLTTYESGVLSTRQVMLEHGLDVTVREVRIGQIDQTDEDELRTVLRERVCENARILPDCLRQLEVEMIQRDPRVAWVALDAEIQCVDRGNIDDPSDSNVAAAGNNELLFLRVCIRIDPFLPSSNLGKALVAGSTTESGESYALVATSAFVVEPFRAEDDGT
ncbi:MAG: TadE/TadG family type IV pilus assembly protein [Pseudomonadota bacterium]